MDYYWRFSASVPYKFWKRGIFDDLVRGTDRFSFKSSNGNKNNRSMRIPCVERLDDYKLQKTIRNLYIRSCPLCKTIYKSAKFVRRTRATETNLRLLIKAIEKGIVAINNIQSKALYIKR